MFSQGEYDHYHRQIILDEVGEAGQQKLKNASVLIVGIGGLGCPVSQYLVAAGVGRVCLMDHDKVSVSNLHRQILFNYDDVGKSKAHVAKDKLIRLNPFIQIDALDYGLAPENCLEVVKDYDLIIDCSDNFHTKYLINDACVLADKPWVAGSLFKFQGQLSFFNYRGGPTYRCLFPSAGDLENCSEAGVIGVLPGIMGGIMAGEALKFFLNMEPSLSGKLLVFDMLPLRFRYHNFQVHEPNKFIKEITPYGECNFTHLISIDQISADDLLIDVRTPVEHEGRNIGGVNINIDEIENSIAAIRNMQKENQRIILYCKSGTRSSNAVSILLKKNFSNVFSINEGIG